MIVVGKMDIGKKRTRNEDAFFVSTEKYGPLPNIYIVADGMGGHKGGAYASNFAISSLCDFLKMHSDMELKKEESIYNFLKRAIMHVNYQLYQKSNTTSEYEGMGTTLTICTVIGEMLYTAHVGDSRLYVINNEKIHQVTVDHSLVQEMLNKGYISKQEANEHPQRNIITRAVGTYEKIKVDTYSYSLNNIEYIFLCSDGISTMISDKEIHTIITQNKGLEQKVNELIALANERGGEDNITVVLAIYNKVVNVC